MKFLSQERKQGSVLVVTLITCGVIATVLGSYLVLLSTRYNLTVRSMAWNATMPVLESGIEEALTHLQYDTNRPGANGWAPDTYGGQPVNTKTRNFADGSYAFVSIANAASDNPAIFSSGFVPAPYGRGYISRTVRVTTTRPKAFSAAIAANGQVSITGSGGIVDSYNSCLGAYSTTNSLGTNGSIATNYKAASAIKVAAGHIYGTVTTGAGGTTTTAGNGSIGDKNWNATQTGIQSDWSDDDMNVAFPTNGPPLGFESYLPIPPLTIEGTNSITYLSSGNYSGTSFTSTDSTKPMIVTGNAILYLSGNLSVSGFETGTRHPGYIEIRPGASLTLYVGGSDSFIAGNGVINRTLQPANLTYYGLNTNVRLTISGSGTFIGTINAPQATLAVSGSGGIFGAAIVGTYANSGSGGFHYDECLGTGSFLTITSWREL